ncbi:MULTISPECIES: acetate--CoA ligase family protein [unclassified Pseudarthrobacter]|uniref:acetate--CoA ligase family protein n=1 Tax=unclassified Pseudarthrobacter TaxID=2647000 RepID=UPI0030789C3A
MTDFASLERLFAPRAIAIVGASETPQKGGNAFARALIENGYEGDIYLINPKGGEILGHKIYRSLDEIPGEIDMFLNLVPKALTLDSVRAAARKGAQFGVIYTADYAETGEAGRREQDELVRTANDLGIRLVGPNSMTIFNNQVKMRGMRLGPVATGGVGIISQSGNVAETIFYQGHAQGLGFSKFVGTGNQADLTAADYLNYLADDDDTKVILMYIESLRPDDVSRFIEAGIKATSKKPVVVLKGGSTTYGSVAASSHTAGLASSAEAYHALFRQVGFIEATHLNELVSFAETLYRCPPMKNPRVALIGSGGGHATMVTDEATRAGLEPVRFTEETSEKILNVLPRFAQSKNPVDMVGAFLGDFMKFAEVTEIAYEDPQDYGGAINFGLYGTHRGLDYQDRFGRTYDSAASQLAPIQDRTGKPIVFFAHSAADPIPAFDTMRRSGIPAFNTLQMAARSLAVLHKRYLRDNKTIVFNDPAEPNCPDHTKLETDVADESTLPTEPDVLQMFQDHGLPVAEWKRAADLEDVRRVATDVEYPVVLKAVVQGVTHKSDMGGVTLDIADADELISAAEDMNRRMVEHGHAKVCFLVMRQLTPDHELFIGVHRDPVIGPVILAGLGGVYAETLNDVVMVLPYASEEEIAENLRLLRSYPVLEGARGKRGVDIKAFAHLIKEAGRLLITHPEIDDIDMNPVLATPDGLFLADGVITKASADAEAS